MSCNNKASYSFTRVTSNTVIRLYTVLQFYPPFKGVKRNTNTGV